MFQVRGIEKREDRRDGWDEMDGAEKISKKLICIDLYWISVVCSAHLACWSFLHLNNKALEEKKKKPVAYSRTPHSYNKIIEIGGLDTLLVLVVSLCSGINVVGVFIYFILFYNIRGSIGGICMDIGSLSRNTPRPFMEDTKNFHNWRGINFSTSHSYHVLYCLENRPPGMGRRNRVVVIALAFFVEA